MNQQLPSEYLLAKIHQNSYIYENPLNFINSPDGRAFGGHKVTGPTSCKRCGFAVYEAEKMLSKGRLWHKRCFSCNDCHKSLDSTNLCDAPDAEIYCRPCYGRLFGPKGVGFGMGAGCLSMA